MSIPAAWLAFLLAAAPAPPYTVVVADTLGQPADELALAAWSQSRHRSSQVAFRWVRVGSPEGAKLGTGTAPPEPVVPGKPKTPDLKPEWDPEGALARAWDLDGMPRVLLLDAQGRVLHREAFMSTPALRELCRRPSGFPTASDPARIGVGAIGADD